MGTVLASVRGRYHVIESAWNGGAALTGGQQAPEKIGIHDLGPQVCQGTDLDFESYL
jgi:hypothetical protein